MFEKHGILFRSDLLDASGIRHGFSTREGGISHLPHTASMNVADGHGDTPETVRENIGVLARSVTDGVMDETSVVYAPQIHSAAVRYVTEADCGRPAEPCDGFFTDSAGVLLMVRTADCVPILYTARRADGSPLIAAVHAGWRGTVAGIAAEAVRKLIGAGADISTVRAAIGQCIHDCCFEVREDFTHAVTEACGADFASRHIRAQNGKQYADLIGMNVEILQSAGLAQAQIDVSPYCTACQPDLFHSHRASHGKRGAMGAVIGIL